MPSAWAASPGSGTSKRPGSWSAWCWWRSASGAGARTLRHPPVAGPEAVEAPGAPQAPRVQRVPEQDGEDPQTVDYGRGKARGRGFGEVAGRYADLGAPEPRRHHLRD